ncbi:MAG TPA: hypothetical protein VMZ06_09410 [Candidatus Bathyarchaeia archaeon]|nr:hypothetical protein [Candidatus Bathyarchaeia archaeon]
MVVKDGQPDQFHLCIWRAERAEVGQVVYRDGVTVDGMVPRADAIVIHEK